MTSEKDSELSCPVLDFACFRNNIISGMSLSEIIEVMAYDNDFPNILYIKKVFKSLARHCQSSTATEDGHIHVKHVL